MAVEEIGSANFEEKTSEGVVLLDFWASWCGPCRMLGPVIDSLASDMAGKASFYKINTDEESALAERFNISSIPAVFILKDGEVVDQFIGLKQKAEIEQIVNKYI